MSFQICVIRRVVILFGFGGVDQVVRSGGFYVSRFWCFLDDNGIMVSKKGNRISKNGWSYTRSEFVNKLRNFINTNDAKTSLISGTAYDTMMKFLHNKTYRRRKI